MIPFVFRLSSPLPSNPITGFRVIPLPSPRHDCYLCCRTDAITDAALMPWCLSVSHHVASHGAPFRIVLHFLEEVYCCTLNIHLSAFLRPSPAPLLLVLDALLTTE